MSMNYVYYRPLEAFANILELFLDVRLLCYNNTLSRFHCITKETTKNISQIKKRNLKIYFSRHFT